MGRSQETFFKKQREKNRERKKKEKLEKKENRRASSTGGSEIDWDSAPENKTMTQKEMDQKAQNRKQTKD
tara:strand:+ start:362 stop:571 length:210 start_codon:yes stop_codon:yes gene_type:complete